MACGQLETRSRGSCGGLALKQRLGFRLSATVTANWPASLGGEAKVTTAHVSSSSTARHEVSRGLSARHVLESSGRQAGGVAIVVATRKGWGACVRAWRAPCSGRRRPAPPLRTRPRTRSSCTLWRTCAAPPWGGTAAVAPPRSTAPCCVRVPKPRCVAQERQTLTSRPSPSPRDSSLTRTSAAHPTPATAPRRCD
jgi:hypothetical protein